MKRHEYELVVIVHLNTSKDSRLSMIITKHIQGNGGVEGVSH
jgi:hypothetical protein